MNRPDAGGGGSWDDLRNRTPPRDLSLEHWWMGLKLARNAIARDLPLSSADGSPFRFSSVDLIQEVQASGQILSDSVLSASTNERTSPRSKARHRRRPSPPVIARGAPHPADDAIP